MKKPTSLPVYRYAPVLSLLVLSFLLPVHQMQAQTCPANSLTQISSFPNTYYPASAATLTAGTTQSIDVGQVTYGTTPISKGDILLLIQMQGAQINSNNTSVYGSGAGTGYGYLVNTSFLAGNMEYVVATNNVPLTGGTINLKSVLTHSYQNSIFGADGQYTYQVIRVPVYYDLQLTGTITAPQWDGVQGGVVVLYATDNIDMNGQTVDASGLGFRGGGGKLLTGSTGGSWKDYRTLAGAGANGSKGEGIAGTPMYVNNNYTSLTTSAYEGYPNGSFGQGAPGNAGGGGTDGDPNNNDFNTGGAGGGNGGLGGVGGNAWSSGKNCGGTPGSKFSQASPSRLVMGGGGGAGTSNNGTGTPAGGIASSGSAGGGIVMVIAQKSIINSGTILANGANGNTTVANDGAGGAGAGGSILIYSGNGTTSNITAQANGGTGGSNEVSGGPSHGPGGGGGGGVIYSNGTLKAGSSSTAGIAGTTAGTTSNYGATAGTTGSTVTNMVASSMATFPMNCTTLAASFIDVSAQRGNNTVNVSWTVAQESATTGYTIQRSTDGVNFSDIGTTDYKQSTGTDNVYQYADNSGYVLGGTLYYRVRENETGGYSVYSKIVSIRGNETGGAFSVFPNPAKSFITVNFTMTAPATVSFHIYDLSGTSLWANEYQASAGQNSLRIDRVSGLPEGLYLLQWFDGSASRTVKIFIQH
jgi:hypothetical protein